ncbi:MAG: hypothetical protein HOO95_05135 [Gallionella sp.]|nr:hypothetical protein [Gallionella sp.]
MLKFTLDTNCVIDLEEDRAYAQDIRRLVRANEQGLISLAIPAIVASENQKNGKLLENFKQFQDRLALLGLSSVEILRPILYFDMAYWDWCLWAGDEMIGLEKSIHQVIFPEREFLYKDYCVANGIASSIPLDTKWRNAKCDVLMLWSHIWHQRDVFVSRDDKAYHSNTKKSALVALGAGRIEYPSTAIALVPTSS